LPARHQPTLFEFLCVIAKVILIAHTFPLGRGSTV
jgi:hypothetical protein